MTNSINGLTNVREYYGSSHIQTTNGSVLPIVAFGDISFSFKDVLVSSKLSMNLAFVGWPICWPKLCCTHFTHGGYVVQDQMSEQFIVKGPKHGCLFYLQQPIPRSLHSFLVLSLLCHKSKVSNEV